ncbi:MAG: hypothetical protein AB7O62_13905 [Pirellulales bacterium]
MTTAFQKYLVAPSHVPVGGESGEKETAPASTDQPVTIALVSDSPDQTPATAMLFEHAADDDAWAV